MSRFRPDELFHETAMKDLPIVLFGAGEMAQVAAFYFRRIGRKVAAFTVDAQYVKEATFEGAPVVAVEEIARVVPPAEHYGFVALSFTRMNDLRTEKVATMRGLGYPLTTYVSPDATNFATSIGENCFILEDNTLQPFVRIGNNVTLWSGNHIGHHSTIEDNVFLTSHVVVSGGVTVGANSFAGVNVTIVDHVKIAPYSLLAAGSLIRESTEPESVYLPNGFTEKRKIPSRRIKQI